VSIFCCSASFNARETEGIEKDVILPILLF